MGRTVFVVSRRDADLYHYLRERFGSDTAVEVILDRRVSERRQRQIPHSTERRHVDRRRRPDVDVELRTRSHAIVSIS
jgi:hypothetical protein